jgi:hypothetical protein
VPLPLAVRHWQPECAASASASATSEHATPALLLVAVPSPTRSPSLSPARGHQQPENLKQPQACQWALAAAVTGPLFSEPAGPLALDRPADPRIGHRAHCMSAQHSAIKNLPLRQCPTQAGTGSLSAARAATALSSTGTYSAGTAASLPLAVPVSVVQGSSTVQIHN